MEDINEVIKFLTDMEKTNIGKILENLDKNKKEKIIKSINNCTSPVHIEQNDSENEIKQKVQTIFNAFTLFPISETQILILGQDPYPSNGQNERRAHGFAFSFGNEAKPDDSLLNIFKAIDKYKNNSSEKNSDIFKWNTNLENWAKKSKILLLNTALTYKENDKHFNSWNPFIKQIIANLIKSKIDNTDENNRLVIFLWGKYSQNIFFQSINAILKTYNEDIFNKKDIENNELYKNEFKFKVVSKVVKKEKGLELVTNKIKIFRTSHPSQISENNDGKFVEYSQKHFADCDKFLDKNKKGEKTWLDFPKNNKKQ